MNETLIEITDWKGGASLSDRLGRKDQFSIGQGVDFRSRPGYLTVDVGWTRMQFSSSVNLPTEFGWAVKTVKDGEYYFGGEDGKLYQQDSAGTIVVAQTSAQAGAIKGMKEYKGYLYYAQNTTVGRSDLAGTPTYTDNWQTGLQSVDYHPMEIGTNAKLYIGNGQYVASWDDTTWTANALDLADRWQVRCISNFGTHLAIGANYKTSSGGVSKCRIFLWDKRASSWNDEIELPEIEIKAMLYVAGNLWVWAGKTANIYVIPLHSRKATLVKSFFNNDPATYSFEVYPGAVTAKGGLIYFGLSGVGDSTSGAVNPAGIYSFPVDPIDFNLAMPYPSGGTYKQRFKFVQALEVLGSQDAVYAGYSDYLSTEVDHIIRQNYYDDADTYSHGNTPYANTFTYDAPVGKKLYVEGIGIDTLPLVDGGGTVTLSYITNDGEITTTAISTYQFNTDSTHTGTYKRKTVDGVKNLKLQVSVSGNANKRPYIKRIYVTGKLVDDER